jgi:predicted MFS family arabinose efflux permease
MRSLTRDRKLVGALFVLSITQVIGWGTVGLPAIVGRQIANDLHMDISSVFAGTSVLYAVMGLWAPVLGRTFARSGARPVMIAGTIAAVPGFLLLSVSQGPVLYFAAWVVLGTAGSATLTTAAYIVLNEIAGRGARRAIGGLMLVTGLSSSVFWPLTSVLSGSIGWRRTCLIYAGVMVLISLPLYVFGLPRRSVPDRGPGPAPASAEANQLVQKSTFYLVVAAIALNAFVTLGFSAVFIELLKSVGLPAAQPSLSVRCWA